MESNTYHVHADWDPEANVWVATSDDVPGLATEAETIEGLATRLRTMIPELLEANGLLPPNVAALLTAFQLLPKHLCNSSVDISRLGLTLEDLNHPPANCRATATNGTAAASSSIHDVPTPPFSRRCVCMLNRS
jgi:predicted RNase H-like HicB family nuclease